CRALCQHVTGSDGTAVLSRMERHRDTRIGCDALELLTEPERRGEPKRPLFTVAKTDRRNRLDHDPRRRCAIAEADSEIAAEDRVEVVVPANGHERNASRSW